MLRRLLFAALLATIPGAALAQVTTRNLTLMSNRNDYPPNAGSPFGAGYSSCWSYIHGDGREYAVIGTTGGTAIYNVTNPAAPYLTGLIIGPNSAWREMKSYRNWIYIVTEGTGAGQGVQVVRMTNPEAPVLAASYVGSFTHSHTVSVDTSRALLYLNGTRNGAGSATGVRVLSLANPEAPVEIGAWPGGTSVPTEQYVHDAVPIGNRLFASSIYAGIQRILDVTNPAAISQINEWSYAGAFTHNAWPDATGNFLYVTDETNGEPLKVFDISDPMNPALATTMSANPTAIVHNAHVMGNELYLANYTEGIRILDLSDPAHPAEFAWADSYPGLSGGFWGVWGVCPFFPSGTVIASDMQTGLYVYRPVRDYGIIRAVVTDPSTVNQTPDACAGEEGGCCCAPFPCACGNGSHHLMAAASGVEVFVPTSGDSLITGADGIVQFAPSPGQHTVIVRPFGFYADSAVVSVSPGSRDTVQLQLVARPRRDLGGVIRDAGTLTGLEASELNLLYTPLHLHTVTGGTFLSLQVPEDVYAAEAHAPGHIPASFLVHHQQFSPALDIPLPATATWDNLEVASGWVVGGAGTGDNATTGLWTRVEPVGTIVQRVAPARSNSVRLAGKGPHQLDAAKPGAEPLHEGHEEDGIAPGDIQPENDRTPPPGTLCFVTGQGNDPNNPGQADVDNGKTSLTSPTFNLSGMTDPVIGFWRWFYASGTSDDWFAVLLSNNNGSSWTAVDTVRGSQAHWKEVAVHVASHLTPTATMKIRFVAADDNPGTVVEAAIDDVVTYDGANTPLVFVGDGRAPADLRFRAAFPNPTQGGVRLVLELPARSPLAVDVLDVQGRRVRALEAGTREAGIHHLIWNGADDAGRLTPAGLYFVRARTAGAEARTRVVRVE